MNKNIPSTGFVDIQVNGFLGNNFSSPELTDEKIADICNALYERGTVAFCPTIITSDPEIYRRNIPLLASAMEDVPKGARILGLHIEGPFLNPGACGAHPEEFLLNPDVDMFNDWMDLANGNISIVTLAPELPGALDLIEKASSAGVVPALGHHLGSHDDIQRAVQAGANYCTHLGNGIANTLPRHPNPIWSQLACDELTAGFISDGHHLPREFIRVALRAKGMDRFVITSDAAPLAGLEPGEYEFGGQEVRLDRNGKISMIHKDALAGSASTMHDCAIQIAEWEDLSRDQIMKLTRENPLRLIEVDDSEIPQE